MESTGGGVGASIANCWMTKSLNVISFCQNRVFFTDEFFLNLQTFKTKKKHADYKKTYVLEDRVDLWTHKTLSPFVFGLQERTINSAKPSNVFQNFITYISLILNSPFSTCGKIL